MSIEQSDDGSRGCPPSADSGSDQPLLLVMANHLDESRAVLNVGLLHKSLQVLFQLHCTKSETQIHLKKSPWSLSQYWSYWQKLLHRTKEKQSALLLFWGDSSQAQRMSCVYTRLPRPICDFWIVNELNGIQCEHFSVFVFQPPMCPGTVFFTFRLLLCTGLCF